jgi:hypothetical protein
MQEPRALAALALVEIARILFEERREYRASDVCAGENVSVRGAEALGVATCALSVFHWLLTCPIPATAPTAPSVTGSDADFQASSNFSFDRERDRVRFVRDEEIRNEAKRTLFLFFLNLVLSEFRRRYSHVHLCHLRRDN